MGEAMRFTGNRDSILPALLADCPGAAKALMNSEHIPAQIAPYQAAALYALAQQYNHEGAHILEIGTAAGYSASIIAQAAPLAEVVTLNPMEHEVEAARINLEPYPNAPVVKAKSWDYLSAYRGPCLDMIFVDGDHKHIGRDLPWWAWLNTGGLMLFHDYSPKLCPPVFRGVMRLGQMLGRDEPDVLLMDDGGVGMAGFYTHGEGTDEWLTQQ